ncbi:MAG: hypothetical protein J5I54_08650 [Bacteroidales bacterium]|nr:hypothetical protein [Bacteroidales bacterium]
MKLNLFLIIGLSTLISCGTQGQVNKTTQEKGETAVYTKGNNELKAKFTTDISNYLDAFNKGDWDGVINMIYPKLFDLITKEQMKQTFNQMEEMGMEMKTDFNKIEKISEVINYKNSKFCRVYYNGGLTIKISGVMLENKDQLGQSLIAAYGLENVKYDGTNNKFDINANKSMIAVSNIDSDEWTYIEYYDQQEEMLKQLIPDKVLEQIIN